VELRDYEKIGQIIREEMGNPTALMMHVVWIVMNNEGITQGEITKMVGTSKAAVSRVLKKMMPESSADSRDIIYQEPDAIDTRSLGVYLRPKGKALKKRLALLQ